MLDDSYGRAHVVSAKAIEWAQQSVGKCWSIPSVGPVVLWADIIEWAHQSVVECWSIQLVGPVVLQLITLSGPSRVWVNVGRYLRSSPLYCSTIPSTDPARVWVNVGRYLRSGLLCFGRYHGMGQPECGRMSVDTLCWADRVGPETIKWACQNVASVRQYPRSSQDHQVGLPQRDEWRLIHCVGPIALWPIPCLRADSVDSENIEWGPVVLQLITLSSPTRAWVNAG